MTFLWIQLSLESLFFPSQRKSFYTEKWNCKKWWSVSILTRPPLEQALGIYSEAQPEWQTAEWLLCTYQLKCQVRQTEINSVTLSRRLNNRDVGRKNHWGVWKGTNEVNLKGGDCSNVGTISFWIPNWFFMAKIKQEQRLESNTVRARPIWLILSANSSFAGSAFITDVKWKFKNQRREWL